METTAASTREILDRSRIELLRAMEGFEHTGIRPPVVRGALFEDSDKRLGRPAIEIPIPDRDKTGGSGTPEIRQTVRVNVAPLSCRL